METRELKNVSLEKPETEEFTWLSLVLYFGGSMTVIFLAGGVLRIWWELGVAGWKLAGRLF